jgi:hypothetical protein
VFYGLVAPLYYITFPSVSRGREGGSFVLLRAELFLALICLFIYNNLPTLDFPLHLWSGKGVASLSLPPLRTVRATFIAYRSSISKALLDGETRQHNLALTSRSQPWATERFRFWAH